MESVMIDGIKFIEILPLPRGVTVSAPVVMLNAAGDLRPSKTLREKLPKTMRILCSEDGCKIAIRESGNPQAFTLKKDGTFRAGNLHDVLTRVGVPLPCRYEMTENGDMWIGTLMPAPPPAPKPDKAATKPRKTGLKDMMPKGGGTT